MNTEKLEKLLVQNEALIRVIDSLAKANTNSLTISDKIPVFLRYHEKVLDELEKHLCVEGHEKTVDQILLSPGTVKTIQDQKDEIDFYSRGAEWLRNSEEASNWEKLAFGDEDPELKEDEEHPFARIFNESEKNGTLKDGMGIEVSVVDLLERKETKAISDQLNLIHNAFTKSSEKKNG